jgi:hypothetical protein
VTLYITLAWQRLMSGRRDDARATLHDAIAQAGVNPVLYRMAQHSAWINMIRMLPEDLAQPAAQATWAQFGADSIDYYLVKILAYRADPARGRVGPTTTSPSRGRGREPARPSRRFSRLLALRSPRGRRDEAARELARCLGSPVLRNWSG